MELRESPDPSLPFLDTVEGEIAFFRSIMRARPIGLHRHFHVLSIRTVIHQDTGRYVSIDDVWEKLRSCYNIEALENLDAEGFESPSSAHSTPSTIDSPSPSDNLSLHPFFRKEFVLPYDEALDSIISSRRVQESSSPSSSSPSPPPPRPPTKGRRGGGRRGRGGGGGGGGGGTAAARPTSHVTAESDSSALTMESGDESVAVAPTPKGSVNTGTDAGTDYGEDEDVEVTASPAPPSAKTARGGRGRGARGRGARARGRGVDSTRGVKKRKRG
ncbi:Chromatin modification-related protein EAF7 domain containing protein [Russula decolorans]